MVAAQAWARGPRSLAYAYAASPWTPLGSILSRIVGYVLNTLVCSAYNITEDHTMLIQRTKLVQFSSGSSADDVGSRDLCNDVTVLCVYLSQCAKLSTAFEHVVQLCVVQHQHVFVRHEHLERVRTCAKNVGLLSFLTLSTPDVPNCCRSKGSAPYWSNPPFLISDIRALWRSVLSARAAECQKLKMVGYTSMAKCKALTGSTVKGLIIH